MARFKHLVSVPGVQRIAHDVDRTGDEGDNAKRKANHLHDCQSNAMVTLGVHCIQQSLLPVLQGRWLRSHEACENLPKTLAEEQHSVHHTADYTPPTGCYCQQLLPRCQSCAACLV